MPSGCRNCSTRSKRWTMCRTSTRRQSSSNEPGPMGAADTGHRSRFPGGGFQPRRNMCLQHMLASAQAGHPRRILGIDPGLRVTGFGIIVCTGNRLQYVASGCIRNASGELPARLNLIVRDLASVIGTHLPTEVAVEKVFVNVNPQSTLLLGQAR